MEPAQKVAIAGMREAFKDVDGVGLPLDDATFARYLRARQWDKEKAVKMLQETLAWREKFGIRSIHDGWQKVIEEENSTGKGYVRGWSTAGNVLLYLRPEHENTHNHDGNLKHLVYNMERACKCMEADGRAEKLVLLIDYHGYSLLNAPPMKTSQDTLSILQNHYPERLFRAYCIRPPWIFNAFWTMISPFIDPVTYQKIVMLSGSKEDIGKRLAADGIPLEQLESNIGGLDRRPFVSKVYLGREQPGAAAADSSSSSSSSSGSGKFAFGSSSVTSGGSSNATHGGSDGDDAFALAPTSSPSSPLPSSARTRSSDGAGDRGEQEGAGAAPTPAELIKLDYNVLAKGVADRAQSVSGAGGKSVWSFW